MASAAVKRYWTRVAALGCLICGRPAQIAHMHGPSLRERDPRFLKPKGKKAAWGDWLVAPLCPREHFEFDNYPGDFFGLTGYTAADMVDMTAKRLDFDPWAQARALLKPMPARDATVISPNAATQESS